MSLCGANMVAKADGDQEHRTVLASDEGTSGGAAYSS